MNNLGCFGSTLCGIWLAGCIGVILYGDHWLYKAAALYLLVVSIKTLIKG